MATIYGTSGNDTITPSGISSGVTGGFPSDADDIIYGYDGDDTIDGGGGNDFISGGYGNDTIFGWYGTDTALYAGFLQDYTIGTSGGYLTLTDHNTADGNDGTDAMSSIEQIAFSDATVQVTGGEFQVNTYTTNDQRFPSVTALADGGFVVTWGSAVQDGSGYGVYGQRYDATGVKAGSEFQVNTYTINYQQNPSVATLADGGFVVTWAPCGQDGSGYAIHGQRYDATGVKAGSEINIYTDAAEFYRYDNPSVTPLADGGFMLTYDEWYNFGYSLYDEAYVISSFRFDANGVETGGFYTGTGYRSSNSVAALADGGFVVTWELMYEEFMVFYDSDIHGQRYDATGVKVGSEFQVNTYTTNSQGDPSVATLADGGFVVTWSSSGQDGSGYGVYGQRYDATGVKAGSEFQVNTYTTNHQYNPSVAALANGGFVVTWSSSCQDGSETGVYGQRYDATGLKAGSEFQVNTYTTNHQYNPSVAALADGGFVVTWSSSCQDGSGYGIYGQRYDAQGNPAGLKVTGTAAADVLNVGEHFLLTVDGAAGNDTINGGSGNDTLYGNDGNDTINGGSGNDYLNGGSGNDTLNGLYGDDFMYGGAGDDMYYIDTAGDVVSEDADSGTDRVNAYISYTLGASVENLFLYGTATTGTGNALNNTINGNGNANFLYGLDGDDYLNGGGGNDTMYGGSGNDTYVIDSASDSYFEDAGSGTDTVYAYVSDTLHFNVERLYLYGTATTGIGNELINEIVGNSSSNSLYGQGGNDSLYGNGGNDILNGGAGNDIMYGGTGNDTYIIDSASDSYFEDAGSGTDTVYAYVNDTLRSNVERLYLYGTATTGIGNELNNGIVGNSNANTLYGQGGNDSLYGKDGNDILNGGTGTDTMNGGTGNDTYIIDSVGDAVIEDVSAGTDRVNAYVSYTLGANVETLVLYGAATNGTGNVLDNTISGNSNANTLYGLDGNDTMNGGTGNDTLNGGAGNDTMYGSAGDDMYYVDSAGDVITEAADSGTDRVNVYINYTLGANAEQLFLYGTATTGYGNALDNKLVGNSNADTLYGYGGNDSLYGYAGNDILNGGTGDDTMVGGAGDDMYSIDSAGDVVSEAASAGADRVNSTINYTLGANVETLVLYGAATNGTGNALDNTISGNSNANTLYGLYGNDTLNGGTGNDTMAGGAGNDTYFIDSVGDAVIEDVSAGIDSVNAYVSYTLGANVETLVLYGAATNGTGNALDNTIIGNSNANTLRGYAGNDILYGYDGNDVLNGFTGNDIMAGGAGNDTYYIDSAGDVVIEGASTGTDRVNAYVSYTLGANVETLVLYGAATNGTGNALVNTIVGNSNDNTLYGLASNDYLSGDAGNDSLNGGTGNDTIVGGIGNDYLYGCDGNDYLNGGAGKDYLYGGTGQDNFAFRESGLSNCDTIVDFSHTDDTIVLKDILDGVTDSSLTGLSFTGTVLNAGSYFEGTDYTGNGTENSGIYNNTTTGEIWYNPTSSTAGDSVLICTVGSTTAASLDNTDFVYSA